LDSFYLAVVGLLILLAVADLLVGVSNDAVNFLNSAFGSRAASRRTILLIASAGVLAGALFSSGMMEVARKGIFHPELFSFADITCLFVAVMLADILLLDAFNTFAMPTSTTVSIVFELLGAALAVALWKLLALSDSPATLLSYINAGSAVAIIVGIIGSVLIAFLIGAAVQFVSRLVFTFQNRQQQLATVIWCALAITCIVFFILLKGLGSASVFGERFSAVLDGNMPLLAVTMFGGLLLLLALLQRLWRINLLQLVVLVGSFSLAMAFASNDLVNFIGVPLAGLAAYQDWSASGVAASEYAMTSLTAPVRGQTQYLLLAGAIMVAALWLSEKARSVTETEISLGRQDAGPERFSPHLLSRWLVRTGLLLGRLSLWLFPRRAMYWIDQRYQLTTPGHGAYSETDAPAFDLLRASVNLTVASILIAVATSMQLPLSTTYVTFMVAMGSSLADRAWGLDSAVFRVSGVINVIAGWFATAAIALLVAFVYASLIYHFGSVAMLVLTLVGVAALVHTHRLHRQRKARLNPVTDTTLFAPQQVANSALQIAVTTLRALAAANRAELQRAVQAAQRLGQQLRGLEIRLLELLAEPNMAAVSPSASTAADRTLQTAETNIALTLPPPAPVAAIQRDEDIQRLQLFAAQQDLYQSAELIACACQIYQRNSHPPLQASQREALLQLANALEQLDATADTTQLQTCHTQIQALLRMQLQGLRARHYSGKNTQLIISLCLEVEDVLGCLQHLYGPQQHDQWQMGAGFNLL